MRKVFLGLSLVISLGCFGQSYHWPFAMNTGACSNQARNYPYDLNLISEGVIKPLFIEHDYAGNTYIMGKYPNLNFSNEYQITPEVIVRSQPNATSSSLYLYKLNAQHKVVWAISLGNDQTLPSDLTLTINPNSGKFYFVLPSINGFYLNGVAISTSVDLLVEKRMMLCFNEDGTYNKVITSKGELFNPIFSATNSGIYRASKIADFYPWGDSLYYYLFDAQKDSIVQLKYCYGDKIQYYNVKKKKYLTEQLAEYDQQLNRTSLPKYYHTHNQVGGYMSKHHIDSKGNHYFYYKDINTGRGNGLQDFLLKLDSNFIELWRNVPASGFALDTNEVPWAIYGGVIEKNTNGPIVKNADFSLIQLNPSTGKFNGTQIVPTNLINQTNETPLFKINQNNEFWFAGFLFNEAEFGDYVLNKTCSNKFLPIQHFVACAKEGWVADRKTLGLGNLSHSNLFAIYPNPAYQELILEIANQNSIEDIEIQSISGVKQTISHHTPDYSKINIEHLLPGIYFLKITLGGSCYTKKFVKL